MRSALAISALLLSSGIPAVNASALFKGCYSSSQGLEDQGTYTYQSTGWCEDHCKGKGKEVAALWKGSHCLCGSELPPESAKVDKSKCDVTCDGYPADMCGGKDTYSIYLVDASDESSVKTISAGSSGTTGTSTATGASSPTQKHVVTNGGGGTVVVTAASESQAASTDKSDGDKKSNTAAIAAGVVVGVVGFCALLGAAFFFYRFKKRKNQQNYLNTAPVEQYGNKPMSTSSNSRFDGDFMAQRRQSNGSIDDDQDFSRRILQVSRAPQG